jgi:hypothetical protein
MKKGILQRLERILAWPLVTRQRALAKSRPPISHSDFISYITQSGGNADAAGIVYSKLQEWVYDSDFTPHPEDSLSSVFGIAEEELDEDIILDIFMNLGLAVPAPQEVMAFGPINTAIDVARFVAFACLGNESKKHIT